MASLRRRCPNCLNDFDPAKWKELSGENAYRCNRCGGIVPTLELEAEESSATYVSEADIAPIIKNMGDLNFDFCNGELDKLLAKYPNSARLHFLKTLAENCICYVKVDTPVPGWDYPYVPTLNNLSFANIVSSEHAQAALNLSHGSERQSYLDALEYCESKRREIEEAYKDTKNHFDIFISVKVSDVDHTTEKPKLNEFGEPIKTTDFRVARDLFELLKRTYPKKKVFFSEDPDTKAKFAGNRYENVIFAALHSASLFILVGNSSFNINWRWVKNEWARYLYLISHDPKKNSRHFIFATDTFHNLNDAAIPPAIRQWEGYDISTLTGKEDFTRGIASILTAAKGQAIQGDANFGNETSEVTSVTSDLEQGLSLGQSSFAVLDEELQAQIDRAIHMATDKNNDRAREGGFRRLEAILEEHPDAYKAKLYLLLRDSKYITFEDYFNDVETVMNDFAFAKEYFQNAERADSERQINYLLGNVNPGSDSLSSLSSFIQEIALPYREAIAKKQLEKVASGLQARASNSASFKDSAYGEFVANYLKLRNFLSGGDGHAYIKARKDLMETMAGKKEVATIFKALNNEILNANKGDEDALWNAICIESDLPIQRVEDFTKSVIADIIG